jgi:hypothetical protein
VSIGEKRHRLPAAVARRAEELERAAVEKPFCYNVDVVRRLRDDTEHMPRVWRELRKYPVRSSAWWFSPKVRKELIVAAQRVLG